MEDYFAAKKKLFFLNSKKRTAWSTKTIPGPEAHRRPAHDDDHYGLSPAALVRAERFKLNELASEALIKYRADRRHRLHPIRKAQPLHILASFACLP